METISQELYQSLAMKYETVVQECKTSLLIYFEKSVGIGDHPNHLDEMDRLIDQMTSATDKLNILQSKFGTLYGKSTSKL